MSRTLQDVADIYYGKSQNWISDKFGHYPIIGTSGVLGKTNIPLFNGPAIVVGRKGTLDNPIYILDEFWAVDTTYAVIPKERVQAKWLYYCLKNTRLDLLNEATGVPSISRDRLYNVPIPEIDYFEQSRIAYVLDTIDGAIRKTEAVIAKLKKIREGMLHDLLTYGLDEHGQIRDPVAHPEQFKDSPLGIIPKDWECGVLGDRFFVQGGFAFRSTDFVDNGDIPLVRISNITSKGLDLSSYVALPYEYLRIFSNFSINKDDLLIAMSGATTGKVALAQDNNLPALLNQRVGRVVKKPNSKRYNSLFILAVLQSYKFQNYISIESMGGAQPNVSRQEIEAYKFAWPNEQEQNRIADILLQINLRINTELQKLNKLNMLKSGLQDDLLMHWIIVPEFIMEKAENHEP